MIRLVQNNDIDVHYFTNKDSDTAYTDAVNFLCKIMNDKIHQARALSPDNFGQFFKKMCEDHIECYEGDNGNCRYKVKLRK